MSTIIIEKILSSKTALIQPGAYLQTKDEIIEDQKDWPETDESKKTDFSGCPFWITTDDGIDPIGIISDDDLKKACPDSDYFI